MQNLSIDRIVGRVSKRLMWFVILLYCLAILDRGAAGFAAVTMRRDLHLTAEMFGIGTGLFFLGYLTMEVPSNIALQRFGAKIWISRITFTWGIVVAAMALAVGAQSFYGFRFLLGIAEAGLFPGIVYYMTLWFPKAYRARYFAIIMTAIPATIALAAPISTSILRLDGWLGLSGWQWIFVLEGFPSVIAGVVSWFYLTDAPANARWLSPEERDYLIAYLEREEAEKSAPKPRSTLHALADPRVITLGLVYGSINIGLTMAANWMPQVVHGIFNSNAPVGIIIAIPFVLAAAAMMYWGRHSDLKGERILHSASALALSGGGWILSGLESNPVLIFGGLTVAIVCLYASMGVFWAIPPAYLSGKSSASGIALVSAMGSLAAALSPGIVGYIKDSSGSFGFALLLIGLVSLVGALLLVALKMQKASTGVGKVEAT